jgi:uncharacterized protein (TIGR02246 family)
MTDQQIKDAIRGFCKSWTSGDVKHALSLFTDDSVWVTPQGTFKGMSQIEKYAKWIYENNKDFKITETGIGIITQGDTAVIEHDVSGTMDGMKWVSPADCIWEFKNGKVARVRTFYDVLSQAQQVAKGPAKLAVNAVVNASQKGLK